MWNPESYTTAAFLLPRLLGFIYFCACGAFLFQIKGLLGANGILPIQDYLNQFRHLPLKKKFFYLPTLFWINASDKTLMAVVALAVSLSLFLMLGIYPEISLALLFILYLSIVTVGQDFLCFGWESFLLETTFYTFLICLTPIPNEIAWINLNFLLFRFHLQAGAVKLQSKDLAWRDLTGAAFHYETQPLPNTWAWYVFNLPLSMHKICTFIMLVIEIAVPFGLFFTDEIRTITGILLISLQIAFWATGNFAFLNYLTAALCIIAFNNRDLSFLTLPQMTSEPYWGLELLVTFVSTLFLIFQSLRLLSHFQYRNYWFNSLLSYLSFFHLVNRYGLFAVMTKTRYEIIVEGSNDGENWDEYLFWYKPSELTRRPRRISPYQPRIDWQMWFLPFDSYHSAFWFQKFLAHLLKGTPEVLKLIRHSPFQDKPPKYVRALIYIYRFSDEKDKIEKGVWWKREFIGPFSPVLQLGVVA